MTSKGLAAAVLLVCTWTFSEAQSSCKNRCGMGYYRGNTCQCDFSCLLYGECCRDFERLCTSKNSCKGRCGETFKRGRACTCDEDCVKYNQCCPDFRDQCSEMDPTPEATEQPLGTPLTEGNDPGDSLILTVNPTFYQNDDPDDASKQTDEGDVPDPSPLPEASSGIGSTISELLLEDFTSEPPLPDLDGFEIPPEPPTTTASQDETTPSSTTVAPSTPEVTVTTEKVTATPEVTARPEVPVTQEEVTATAEEVPATPEEVTATPEEVTATPEEVTATPEEVTATPEEVPATAEEVTATAEEVTATPEEVTATPEEVTATPEEVTATPEEVTATAEEVTATPEEVTATAEEVTATPEEVTATPEEVTATTEEVTATPEEVTATPEEVTATAEEVTATPEEVTATAEEVTATPEEVVATAEEVTATPEEVTATPAEVVATAEEVTATPEVTATQEADDSTTAPEPTASDLVSAPDPQTAGTSSPPSETTTLLPGSSEPTAATAEDRTELTTVFPTTTPTNEETTPEPQVTEEVSDMSTIATTTSAGDTAKGPSTSTSKPAGKPLKPALDPDNKPVLNGLDDSTQYPADDNNDMDLCSGRPIGGVTTLRNGTVVVFRGHYFWVLDRNRVPGPARGIAEVWGVQSPIDTVFTRCNCQGKTYIFKGPQYWRYENDVLDPGFPKVVEVGFDGLRGHITAALSVPQYNRRRESVYFFKRGGNVQKYSYQFGTNPTCGRKVHHAVYIHHNRQARQALAHVSLLGPSINYRTSWRGFPTTITAAVSIPNKREPEGYSYHVFSRAKSYKIRIEGERPVIVAAKANASHQSNDVFKCPRKLSQSQ